MKVEEFLARHGIRECLEESVKELVLHQPLGSKAETRTRTRTIIKTSKPAAPRRTPLFEEQDVCAVKFLAAELAVKVKGVAEPTRFERAVHLFGECDPRKSNQLLDGAAEAFLLLAKGGNLNLNLNSKVSNLDHACISPQDMNQLVDELCKNVPDQILHEFLPLVQWSPEQKYMISFNDFMCTINPCIVLKHLVFSANSEFENLDINERGKLTIDEAMNGLSKIDWDLTKELDQDRRKSSYIPHEQDDNDYIKNCNDAIDENCNENDQEGPWKSVAKQIVSDLPSCSTKPPSNEILLNDAREAFQLVLESSSEEEISRDEFISVVVLHLSALRHLSQTWMK